MAARLTNRQADLARESIKVGLIVKRLSDHVAGSVEMTNSQIRAAGILLKKCLPDLQSIDHTGDVTFNDVTQLTREALERIAASGSAGVIEAPGRDGEPSAVH